MSKENKLISVEFDINRRIDGRIKTILDGPSVALPLSRPDEIHPLVEDYIKRIEGTYDVTRSKEDTDNAIDLLYIAYNTTPQEEGGIRGDIDRLMSSLIEAQQESELKMGKALSAAGRILKSLQALYGDWEEVRDNDDMQDLKDFVGEDLFDLAEEIKGRAERISSDLTRIAKTYDSIIDRTSTATNQSEQALANRLENEEKIKKEIRDINAEREKLESLVTDLRADINKYEKMANEYKAQAETAEQRAFLMSVIRVGAQMVTSAIPAITAGITGAATGGTSLVVASAAGTARQMMNSETAATDNDNTADVIKVKKDMADRRMEMSTAEREKSEFEKKGKALEGEKKKIEGDKETDAGTRARQLAAVNKRIRDNTAEIKAREDRIATATTALNGLQASLQSLGDNMGQMADKQEQQATALRDLQMKMLEKVEAYEREKRTQAAELVKINALLKGHRTEEETIQLAIKSLNLSLKALKRVREIIVEISFFFKSFAYFMQQVMENSEEQSKKIQKALDKDRLTKRFTRRIKRNTNDFFVTQTAEWQAVEIVSGKFGDNFKHGWSKLNKLSGNYLTGEELKAYMDIAAGKIEDIAFQRKQASTARLAELNRYRDRIRAQA